jgi:Subtilisin inhibitor-like
MVVKTLNGRARPSRLSLTLATSIAGLIAVAGAAAGCGAQLAPGAAHHGKGTAVLSGPAKVDVTVSILNKKGGGGPTHWTLRCQPDGGTAPNPVAACKALFSVKKKLTQLKKPIMCPMIMLGAEQIVLKGKLFGQPVNRVIADGGCDVGIFNSLKQTFR